MPDLNPKKRKCERALILSGGGTRGAYQVGVWKFLSEFGWKPDLICGSSVGAVNAAAIGCGIQLEELIDVWHKSGSRRAYRISWWQHIKNIFLSTKGFVPLADVKRGEKILRQQMGDKIDALRKSEIEIIITAVNLLKSELKFFDNSTIDIDHIMASCAIPVLFPWRYIDGEPYWDGGVMMNTPILPALDRKAREIIVVLLSAVGGNLNLDLPRTRAEAVERAFEQRSLAAYQSLITYTNWNKEKRSQGNILMNILQPFYYKDTKIITVAPQRNWSLGSILSFSEKQVKTFIQEGYTDACEQLAQHFNLA